MKDHVSKYLVRRLPLCRLAAASIIVSLSLVAVSAQTSTTLSIRGEQSEVSSGTNGATVTPTVGPVGVLRVKGSGKAQFAPGGNGNGVYFSACCDGTNNAYYEFGGARLGDVFAFDRGEISLTLISRQSWASRKASTFRTVFSVQDIPGNYAFSLTVGPTAGRLAFGWRLGSRAVMTHYVPAGAEDAVFGLGKSLSLRLVWDGSRQTLFMNGQQTLSAAYTPATPSWSASSVFIFGANNAPPLGVYNSCDDVIDEFLVAGSRPATAPDKQAPSAPTGLAASAKLPSRIDLTWTAAKDDVGVAGYRVYRNGAEVGTATATSYSDMAVAAATAYTYQVTAYDAAGNVSPQSTAASATTPAAPIVPSTPVNITPNTWVGVSPKYTGGPEGGRIWPMGWNSMGVYDPATKRTLAYDRWYDPIRGQSIYANTLMAYDPATNTVEVLKVNNWQVKQRPDGGYNTEPLASNASDPTPVDRHPFGGVALDSDSNHVYLINGLNQTASFLPQDTWKFNLATKKWTKVADQSGPHPPNDGGRFSSAVYDAGNKRLVQFDVLGALKGTLTWVMDPAAGTWSSLPQDPSAAKVFVSGAGVAYDSKRGRILAFGGGPSYWITSPQLWEYSLQTNRWTRLSDAPTAASAPEFAYDSTHDIFLALSGSDTLLYEPAADSWHRLPTPTSIPRVKQLNFQNLTYNAGHDVFVFEGGTFDTPLWYLFRYNKALLPALPTDNRAPSAPTGLAATAVSAGEIQLTWNAATDDVGVAGYRVYNSGSFRGVATSTTYRETGLLPSMSYSFTVAAYDAVGNLSAQSAAVSAKTLPAGGAPALALSKIMAEPVAATSAVVTWTTNVNASGEVEYGPTVNYGKTVANASMVTSHSLSLGSLTPGTTYHYRVRSKDASGATAVSGDLTFTTAPPAADTQPPSVPMGLTASAVSSSSISLKWTASTDNVAVTGYRVYRDGSSVGAVSLLAYSDTGLQPATAYRYQVSALDAANNESPLSTAVAVTTPAASNRKPVGALLSVDPAGQVTGWAQDDDDLSKPVKVRIYIDANAGQAGAAPIEVVASAYRDEVGNHGFTFVIPSSYRDGRAHQLWAWAVDLTNQALSSSVQLAGSPKSFTLAATTPVPPPPPTGAFTPVPLTIQEAIYPGVTGVNRLQDPVTVGVPLPDGTGITDTSRLSVSGASAAQFRVLGRWPSGDVKWVLVDTLADVLAGGQNTALVLTTGAGDFGGEKLAVDTGATITVNTGAAEFTIRKAGFNVLDKVVVGGKTLVASGTSHGLVVNGPAPGMTTCPPCATVYSSVNDPASTAEIEENGPVRTVVKATGYHKDAAGNAYMAFTVRLHFYRNQTRVKVNSILRNADWGASNSFNSAYKGFESYDLQLTNALAGTRTFAFGTHAAPVTGSLAGNDSAYLYQGASDLMRHLHWSSVYVVPFSPDKGYEVVKNNTTLMQGLTTGTDKQFPEGWAEIGDSSGAGIGVGVYQLSAHWPKSLEFNAGGSDIRVGIWPKQNSIPYYQSWPQYSIHDIYLNFHGPAATTPPVEEFKKFQHYLVARAPRNYYNATKVFPYPLVDPEEEDNYYKQVGAAATPSIGASRVCCTQDLGLTNSQFGISTFRYWGWQSAGGGSGMGNEAEYRWSLLLNFLSRGWSGRYLTAAHFYRYQTESAFPRSDGFSWRNRPLSEVNAWGFPSGIVSANSTNAHRTWIDQEHGHWYGVTDFYFMTGDETIRDGILDGPKDRFLNPNVMVNYGRLYNTRAVGAQLASTARFSEFLKTTGDADAEAVLEQGVRTYDLQVKPELCVSGFPSGCSYGVPDNFSTWKGQGISRTRGLHFGETGYTSRLCGVPHQYRISTTLFNSILLHGIWEFARVKGPRWSGYEEALDLAEGSASWLMREMFMDDGTTDWVKNGYRVWIAPDFANGCNDEYRGVGGGVKYPGLAVWSPFLLLHELTGDTSWNRRFAMVLQANMANVGVSNPDFGMYQTAAVIDRINKPISTVRVDVPVSVVDLGAGSYRLSWTVPRGAQEYRIKWGGKRIVDWIGFDAGTNQFIGDPVATMPWFAATNIADEPAPAADGSTQTFVVNGLSTGLKSENFAMKALVSR